MPEFDFWTAMPVLAPAIWGLMMLLFAPHFRDDQRWVWGWSIVGMVLTLAIPINILAKIGTLGDLRETAGVAGLAMLRTDRLSLWLDILFALAGLAAVLIMPQYLKRAHAYRPEVYPLLFLSVSGMALMVGTENLMMVFLGLEVLSIPLYILTALTREKPQATEAAMKYFLLGAFSTGFLVYGLALVLGATGRFDLPGIAAAIRGAENGAPYGGLMLLSGLALMIVAFAFKVGAVPFHFWAPDVYQGAPTPVTAFMAVGTKAAAFGVLLRILHTGFGGSDSISERWIAALSVLAVLTMVVGNLLALVQYRVKRLLAYSSIAHAGYLFLALIAPLPVGAMNLVFYLFAYGFMTLGAFAVVTLFQDEGEDADHIDNFAGLWHRRPWLAAVMAAALLSLTGIPPFGGFTGKYVVFMAALQSGHPWLATVMALSAVVGAAYYLKVIVAMFLQQPTGDLSARLTVPVPVVVVLAVSTLGTILLGILPMLALGPMSRIHAALIPLP